ncbi:MAG: glycosyltransferase [Solirubrobacteraceae bacterium]
MLEALIFSKDRACQLDLLLRSMKYFFAEWASSDVQILYTFSSPDFGCGYALVQAEHPEFSYVCELNSSSSFRELTLGLVAGERPYVTFFVDDDVFKEPFTLEAPEFAALATDSLLMCLSLRMCPRMNYAYTLDRFTAIPRFDRGTVWDWRHGEGDWGYPMSIDGHIFRTGELVQLIRVLDFSDPNTLEDALSRNPLPMPRAICFAESKIVNLPINRVQDTFPNRHGYVGAAFLNEQFLAGLRLSLATVIGVRPPSPHHELELLWKDTSAAGETRDCTGRDIALFRPALMDTVEHRARPGGPSWIECRDEDERLMSSARRFLEKLLLQLDSAERPERPIPEATPPREHRRLCVGMATFDDFDGVWFTIQALRMFHAEVADQLAFVIVDNHPEGPVAHDLKQLDDLVPCLRYVPFGGFHGTAVRDLIFREANADIVCCLDSHVLLKPGALEAIVGWFDKHPDSRDLLQGPLLADTLDAPIATHFEPEWGANMYGRWALDERINAADGQPFEVGMQGLGLFACRREAWPGINSRFRGFGGEEGYLHEKVRRGGGRTICHPSLGWAHRFARPHGPPYPTSWEGVLRNYLIGWNELGWDTASIDAHFREQFEQFSTTSQFEQVLARARREATNPFSFFDGIFCLSLDGKSERWAQASRRHEALEVAWQVERFPAVATPDNHHRGCAMSFRRMIAEAKRRDYEHVLILEDDAVFLDEALSVMREAAAELPHVGWDLCYLGACVWGQEFPFLPGSRVLQACGPVTCTHAVAVHRRAYDRILADIPATEQELERWLDEWLACDQYLSRQIGDGTFRAVITSPRVATQPSLLSDELGDGRLADRYVV